MGKPRSYEELTEEDLGEDEFEDGDNESMSKILREDVELSKGEFTDDLTMMKYYEQSVAKGIEKAIRKRRKSAAKAERRMGGPPKMWSEADYRKRASMSKEDKETAKSNKTKEVKAKKEEPKKEPKKEEPKKAAEKKGDKKEKEVKGKDKGKDKKKKEAKERGDRGPSVSDGKITLLAKENPKREGSNAFKKFELYKKHKTVKAFLEAGGKRSSLRYDAKKGYIKLSNVKYKGGEEVA